MGGEGGNKCINKSIKIFRAGSALTLAPFPDKKQRKQHVVNPSIQQCLEDEPKFAAWSTETGIE